MIGVDQSKGLGNFRFVLGFFHLHLFRLFLVPREEVIVIVAELIHWLRVQTVRDAENLGCLELGEVIIEAVLVTPLESGVLLYVKE